MICADKFKTKEHIPEELHWTPVEVVEVQDPLVVAQAVVLDVVTGER